MKRTSQKAPGSTAGELSKRADYTVLRRWEVFAGIVFCSILMFLAGRIAAPVSPVFQQGVESLKLQILEQQREVDQLERSNRQGVNALAARLAELQAASTRLDALGERLAQMGQLSMDEFDFSKPAALGGPADYDDLVPAGERELRQSIAALSDKLRRQSSQLDALQFLMMNRKLEAELTPSGWPVGKGWISSRFGERSDPFTGETSMHWGLDFSGTAGTDVLSVASGVVIWSANRTDYGKTIEIDHGNGYVTRYAHNSKLVVTPGEHVSAGQLIAQMGSSGRASGPHVHLEVLKNGQRINPAGFVSHLR